jgi:Skp family chaperone for outer membrane proteins
MKLLSLIVLLVAVGGALAQSTSPQPVRIAVIDTGRFFNQSAGIEVLLQAERERGSDTEFTFAGPRIKQEISKVQTEIAKLQCSNNSIDDKAAELSSLKRKYEDLETSDRVGREKWESMIIDPILKQVRDKLAEYSVRKGIDIVIDKNYADPIIIGDRKGIPDITDDFIKYCNKVFAEKD